MTVTSLLLLWLSTVLAADAGLCVVRRQRVGAVALLGAAALSAWWAIV